MNGVAQQGQHRICDAHRLQEYCITCIGITDQDAVQALAQIIHVIGQAQDGHDFRCRGDIESTLAGNSLETATQPEHDIAQATVIHIHDPAPCHLARVEL